MIPISANFATEAIFTARSFSNLFNLGLKNKRICKIFTGATFLQKF